VRIGDNVTLWSGNHIGHHSVIEANSFVSSHVVISGHCVIGERTFMGVNATTKDFVTVNSDTFVAMDASITRDVPAGSVVLGARSQVHNAGSEMAERIRSNYFGS
jgi:acyl-[acyl carrier protein]--UDP-N-acetylglucosamine O-acyltransferase